MNERKYAWALLAFGYVWLVSTAYLQYQSHSQNAKLYKSLTIKIDSMGNKIEALKQEIQAGKEPRFFNAS